MRISTLAVTFTLSNSLFSVGAFTYSIPSTAKNFPQKNEQRRILAKRAFSSSSSFALDTSLRKRQEFSLDELRMVMSSEMNTLEELIKRTPDEESEKSIQENAIDDIESLSAVECKTRLVDLIPRMTGKAEENAQVENLVNRIEELYMPMLTLDFFNMAMAGEWQLLLSTNQSRSSPRGLRLRELVQKVNPNNLKGNISNFVQWDLAEDDESFDFTGTFSVECSYEMNSAARLHTQLDEHILKPTGDIPSDVQKLVGKLMKAMPFELFDPNDVGVDTTYLDADLRIVRLSGERYEGVRNIFIRKGAVEIATTIEST